jgi:Zn-finger protein
MSRSKVIRVLTRQPFYEILKNFEEVEKKTSRRVWFQRRSCRRHRDEDAELVLRARHAANRESLESLGAEAAKRRARKVKTLLWNFKKFRRSRKKRWKKASRRVWFQRRSCWRHGDEDAELVLRARRAANRESLELLGAEEAKRRARKVKTLLWNFKKFRRGRKKRWKKASRRVWFQRRSYWRHEDEDAELVLRASRAANRESLESLGGEAAKRRARKVKTLLWNFKKFRRGRKKRRKKASRLVWFQRLSCWRHGDADAEFVLRARRAVNRESLESLGAEAAKRRARKVKTLLWNFKKFRRGRKKRRKKASRRVWFQWRSYWRHGDEDAELVLRASRATNRESLESLGGEAAKRRARKVKTLLWNLKKFQRGRKKDEKKRVGAFGSSGVCVCATETRTLNLC